MLRLLFIYVCFFSVQLSAQELNCAVTVNAGQLQNSNEQVYKTLENAINEYFNNTRWTNKAYKSQEKIQCAITLNILEQPSSNRFIGNIQVQASRPVFNSTYQTPILNYMDDNLTFIYNEFQPLNYNENSFDSNLISILTFYAYTILGIDADTFAMNGGQEYLVKAEKVVNLAQQGGAKGWNRKDGSNTRYQLNENMLSSAFLDYRTAMYEYHRNGLDAMSANKKEAKKSILDAVLKMEKVYNRRVNAYLLRVFMDTKADEIVDIFSGGPRTNNGKLKEMLLKIYPSYNTRWDKIKI